VHVKFFVKINWYCLAEYLLDIKISASLLSYKQTFYEIVMVENGKTHAIIEI
jgi:hypothetical protein